MENTPCNGIARRRAAKRNLPTKRGASTKPYSSVVLVTVRSNGLRKSTPFFWRLLSNLQMKLANASRSIPPLLQRRLIQPGSAEMSVVFQPPSHPCELDLRRSSIHTIGIPSAWLHLTASYPVLVGSVSSGPSRECNCPCSCTHLSSVLSHNLRWSFPPPSATSAGLLCDTRHIGPFLHV